MTLSSRAILVTITVAIATSFVGCSTKESTTIEVTDDAVKMYEEYDKDTQANAGAEYK